MLSLVRSYIEKQKTYQQPQTREMPNKKLREKRRRQLELSRASAATEDAGPSNTEQSSENVPDDGETALDTSIPARGSRFKEELPAADAPLPNQGCFKEDLPAADENGTLDVDIGLCVFAPRVAKEIERRNISQAEQLRSRREPQAWQRQREERRTLSQEQMPPPPRPRDIQPSRTNKNRRSKDESHSETTAFSQKRLQDPHLPPTNGETDSQVKSVRHRRIQEKVRRNLGLNQRTSKEDESNHAEDLPKSSAASLPGLVELCNAALIMMTIKDPCSNLNAIAQKPGSAPDNIFPLNLFNSEATKRQLYEELAPGQQSYTRQNQHRKARTESPILNSPAPPLEPASVSTTQEKTFYLEELLSFYQTRELHTINTGPATLYSCAAHDAKVAGAILAYPSFILLHAGKKYPEWPSLIFSSTDDTAEEFGCIHSLPRVHKDRQLDAVPVFKEVTWLIRGVSATDLEESDGETGTNITSTGTVSEGVATPTQDSGIGRSTETGKRTKAAEQGKTIHPVLSEDSNELANGRDFDNALPEDFLEGRRATFLGWFDILGVRYHERRPQALHEILQRMRHESRTGARFHPTLQRGSATQQGSAKVAENHKGLFQFKDGVSRDGQMPPEGPAADANPMERSLAATPGRISPPPPPPRRSLLWDPSCPEARAKTLRFSKFLEARASAPPPSPPPAPPSRPQSEKDPEPPLPFTAHLKEKACWTLIRGEAFVNVTLEPVTRESRDRVVERHGEEALTDPLTKGYKRSVTVAEDGSGCEIERIDVLDGDAVFDTLGRRFGRACAVWRNNGDGSGGDDGRSGSRSSGSDGKISGGNDDFGKPYAGTEGCRGCGVKKRSPRAWGQENERNGGDDEIDHVAGEERSANTNGVHNTEHHHDSDNHEPNTIPSNDQTNPPANTPDPTIPPPSHTIPQCPSPSPPPPQTPPSTTL
ncbi:MAG: hypothetical protein OHK93_006100 [Ramalina farinacea]|uniref:Uncharacterized protein n=1 Tax=Ramalina farinacea TaxID=258253 RepID=A0AA43QHW5_9LECA|nr:hypothetical protein [Ramalina farinacea]